MSAQRSADRVVDELNHNKPAIMIANGFQDSLLDPSSLVSFFDKLTTPKRLQLATGDHGGPEWTGILGQPNPTVQAAAKWLDHYLNGTKNGVTDAAQVVLQNSETGASQTYSSWPANSETLQLGRPGAPNSITTTSTPTWSQALTTGSDGGANVPATQGLYGGADYRQTTVSSGAIRSGQAYVWNGAATPDSVQVTGLPALSVHVRTSAPSVTLFAYLYDVTGAGAATLMTYAPATVSSGAVSITLRPVSWTVSAGHHLMLVVDTADPAYGPAEAAGSTVTLSSPGALSFATG
jgi:predicted acyl esterase